MAPSQARQATVARSPEKPYSPSRLKGWMSTGHAARPEESVSQEKPVPNQPRVHSRRNHRTPANAQRRQGESARVRAMIQEKIPPHKATYMPSRMEHGAARSQGKEPYMRAATAIQYRAAAAPGMPAHQPRRNGAPVCEARRSTAG